jgi:hypothetical protein
MQTIWIGTSFQSSSGSGEEGGISFALLDPRSGSGSGLRVREDGGGGDGSGVVVDISGDSGTGGAGGAGGGGPCLLRFAGRAEKTEGVERFGGIILTV